MFNALARRRGASGRRRREPQRWRPAQRLGYLLHVFRHGKHYADLNKKTRSSNTIDEYPVVDELPNNSKSTTSFFWIGAWCVNHQPRTGLPMARPIASKTRSMSLLMKTRTTTGCLLVTFGGKHAEAR
ncbi:uncharacterized protein LOC124658346 [Lolium rigidum]|uniref:uncharacterized protein LOC124658346 n=1 Tax=Lolium rigidum TaxID=89674 RepID=UPI001F5CAE03|nr:uncharacterized protein LOC124658346 [Lolium rigidum]